ncbi:DUF1835 domain-containing protein [bacterium SCSIO 12741]|nr:DUF1835 domain-containing protein [bacterium SCSIO 12741]
MPNNFHILNGDALREQFPKHLHGEIIIARECLVDGPVNGNTLVEFYTTRAQFISEFYGDYSTQDYWDDTVSELEKIRNIPEDGEVNLWFEDDLFCQVNFWFVAHLLFENRVKSVFLIRPKNHNLYGFGTYSTEQLEHLLEEKIQIESLKPFAQLWKFYQNDELEALRMAADELSVSYPFVTPAVKAHLERIPNGENPGRPIAALQSIMQELNTDKFGPIFQEFCKRQSIYGFGDLQVKRLFDQLKKPS